MRLLRIGLVASQAGIQAGTLRYYERKGVIPRPTRSGSGYRLYSPDIFFHIRIIQGAKGLHFTLREIKELLAAGESSTRCSCVREIVRDRLKKEETELQAIRTATRRLTTMLRFCNGRCGRGRCRILHALSASATAPGTTGQ